MDKNTIKILISVVIILAAVGIAYFLDFTRWKEINSTADQIKQFEALIQAKKDYYAVIDSKMNALVSAGWDSKKDSIAINFDSSLFFTPKINNFFKNIVTSSGMTLGGMTNSLQESVKGGQTAAKTDTGTSSSKESAVQQTTADQSSSYLNQLQGLVKKTTVNLSVVGTYAAFKNLLSQFENQTRIITIKGVTVSSISQGIETATKTKAPVNNDLNFSLILDVYSY
jgi:hypothetical protein